jgi:hypothetical protein
MYRYMLDNAKYLHHYVLKGCDADITTMRGTAAANGTGAGTQTGAANCETQLGGAVKLADHP